MIKALQIFRKHWLSLIGYVLYVLLWIRYLTVSNQYQIYRQRDEPSVSYGEGVAYIMLFTLLVGFLFTVLLIIMAIFRKKNKVYYLIMSLLTALPVVLFILIDGDFWGTSR